MARREMVERAAADNGAEECLEPPRRADEKQAVSDITPSPGSRRPSADATQHIETDTAPDDDEPHPVGFGARARSERAEQGDGEDSSAPGRAKPLEMRLHRFGRLSVSGGAPGSPVRRAIQWLPVTVAEVDLGVASSVVVDRADGRVVEPAL